MMGYVERSTWSLGSIDEPRERCVDIAAMVMILSPVYILDAPADLQEYPSSIHKPFAECGNGSKFRA